ncbi:MAG: cyclic pyranopterin phosphate synthase [Betaproteobacteria bacterium RIFCSPLOWO2_02_FULL_62_17]|nr:MAG: cyclic pyranopterin phosphate synthase [Betaproteobacteria bacterium RIFCSPLOWO2_02_FULL_62_17]
MERNTPIPTIPIADLRRGKALPAAHAQSGALADSRGRQLRDLRISVTDRCNFRCVYCMPKEIFGADYQFLPRSQLLDFDEITRLVRIFKERGIAKVRLTGGEPLLRKNIEHLIEQIAAIGGLDIALTTNGSMLARMARGLRDAGLDRVTVSLDAIDEATFQKMNDAKFPVAKVLEGIDAAAAAGLTPVKINMVVKRGLNEHAILPMARHFHNSGRIVRFIEYMDVGSTNGWRMDDVISSRDIVERIGAVYPLEQVDPHYTGEVAERWRYRDGSGEIGVISSVTQAFCHACTRARLSTEGMLYTCLFAQSGYDLRALLRNGTGDDAIGEAISGIWQARDDRYSEIRTEDTASQRKIEMSYIGG